MFCINCGTQLADDAAFCFNCGAKVNGEGPVNNFAEATEVASNQVNVEPVVQPMVEQQPMMEQPTFQQPMMEQQPVYQQPAFQQPDFYNQQPFGGQMYTQTKPIAPKKTSKATVPAVIFAILSVLLSGMVCVYGFVKKGDLGMGLENIAFVVASIFVIAYAVSTSKVSALLKGISFIAVAALHTIYYCIPAAKEASVRLKAYFGGNDQATGTDCFYGIALIGFIAFFALYMLMNIVRSFMNSKKVSMLMLISAYFAMLLCVVCFVVDFASDVRGLFAFKFIPVDIGLITLILADIFAAISRAKKMED